MLPLLIALGFALAIDFAITPLARSVRAARLRELAWRAEQLDRNAR